MKFKFVDSLYEMLFYMPAGATINNHHPNYRLIIMPDNLNLDWALNDVREWVEETCSGYVIFSTVIPCKRNNALDFARPEELPPSYGLMFALFFEHGEDLLNFKLSWLDTERFDDHQQKCINLDGH